MHIKAAAKWMSLLQRQTLACGSIVTILILIAVLNTSLLPLSSESQLAKDNTLSDNNVVEIFQPDSNPYGLTYGDWTARWWQWAYSIPKDVNPSYDDMGKYCANAMILE
jgi:hypothetical protein